MTQTPDNGGPAFPPFHDPKNHDSGMTLRDWFAGQALVGLLSAGMGHKADVLALLPYEIADAMIAARKGGAK
jgi:hypothetical protein